MARLVLGTPWAIRGRSPNRTRQEERVKIRIVKKPSTEQSKKIAVVGSV
jgi:hypothetical protein